MTYSATQIERAKRAYNAFMQYHTMADYDVEHIGTTTAEQRMEAHNRMVSDVKSGKKEVEKEWKYFFLNEEAMADQKAEQSKAKKAANKAASADVLEPIKEMRKLGEFGKWLNTSGNPYRKQHFNKVYTQEAVNDFLATI